MSIVTRWYDAEKTIIVHEFNVPWVWPEFNAEVNQAFRMLDEISHPATIILDFTPNTIVPNNALAHIRRAASRKHANLRSVIIVGSNPLMSALSRAVAKISPHTFEHRHIVKTMDHALGMIKGTGVQP